MVKAIFKKKYSRNVVCLACGLFLIGLCAFVWYTGSEVNRSDLLTGITLGTMICVFSTVCLFLNFKAYLCIDENGNIKGRYHYFGKIDCRLADVVFAMGRNGTLVLQLKDGKSHTIMGMENAWSVAFVIRKNMVFEGTEQADALIAKWNHLKRAKKNDIVRVCIGSALLCVNIFLAVLLTGGREMHEFSKTDRMVFAVMGAIELATLVLTFWFAQKAGKKQIPIEKLQYDIRRTVIETAPLFSGFVIAVYTDYDCYKRITVLGYPHLDVVYCVSEKLDANYNLLHNFTSEKYENREKLLARLGGWIDITEKAR